MDKIGMMVVEEEEVVETMIIEMVIEIEDHMIEAEDKVTITIEAIMIDNLKVINKILTIGEQEEIHIKIAGVVDHHHLIMGEDPHKVGMDSLSMDRTHIIIRAVIIATIIYKVALMVIVICHHQWGILHLTRVAVVIIIHLLQDSNIENLHNQVVTRKDTKKYLWADFREILTSRYSKSISNSLESLQIMLL